MKRWNRQSAALVRRRGVAAVGILSLGAVLGGCGVSTGPTATATQALPAGAFSTLDAAGVEQIRDSRTARFDMRSGTLQKSAMGLEPTKDYGPDISTRDPEAKIQLTILGPTGEVTAETDRIRFNITGSRPDISELTYFLTADSPEEYLALIRDGVERYGIDGDSAEDWIASTKADLDSSEQSPYSVAGYSLPSGRSTGADVNYDLRYDGTKETQVIIVHVRPVRS